MVKAYDTYLNFFFSWGGGWMDLKFSNQEPTSGGYKEVSPQKNYQNNQTYESRVQSL